MSRVSRKSLIKSLIHRQDALLEFLFEQGVDPNQNYYGQFLRPLGVSVAFKGDIKWTERLLHAGAKVEESGALQMLWTSFLNKG